MAATHDHPTKTVKVRELDSTCVLVGECGGLSAIVGGVEHSFVMGCMAVETEHGTLYLDPDEDQEVIDA